MTILYMDANAFAKLYLDEETGKDEVLSLIDQYGKVGTCVIGYAEVCGVFARYFHEGKIDEEGYQVAIAEFQNDWAAVEVIQVSSHLSQLAAQLLKSQRGLRAMDALHLAAALTLRQSIQIRFVSFDKKLQEAAQKLMPEAML